MVQGTGPESQAKEAGGLNGVRNLFRGRKLPGTARATSGRRDKAGSDQLRAKDSNGTDRDHAHVLASPGTAAGGQQSPSTQEAQPSAPSPGVASRSSSATTQGAPLLEPAQPEPREPGGNAAPPEQPELRSNCNTRRTKFQKLLAEQVVDLDALRELCWSGVPADLRPICWRLLSGYLPPNRERRETILQRRRDEYRDMVPQLFDMTGHESLRGEDEATALRQVQVDAPRTAPEVAFFAQPAMQQALQRVLYLWGIRHPASGYVQGINDLLTPFLAAFLSEHFPGHMDTWRVDELAGEVMVAVEADAYFCLCKLLEGIQDHYTYAQPGIQRTVFSIKELVRRIDVPFAQHLEEEGLEFLQFAFRWVNCLLLREVPFALGFRLWDTYLAEGGSMKEFLVYVAASFLLHWQSFLLHADFQEMVLFLQKPPTSTWSESEVELILSRAYMWRASFNDARSHLVS